MGRDAGSSYAIEEHYSIRPSELPTGCFLRILPLVYPRYVALGVPHLRLHAWYTL
jgi:hypothetical protein